MKKVFFFIIESQGAWWAINGGRQLGPYDTSQLALDAIVWAVTNFPDPDAVVSAMGPVGRKEIAGRGWQYLRCACHWGDAHDGLIDGRECELAQERHGIVGDKIDRLRLSGFDVRYRRGEVPPAPTAVEDARRWR